MALHGAILLSLIHGDDLHTTGLNSVGTGLSSTGEGAGDLLQLFFLRTGDDLDNIATERGRDLDLEAVLHRSGDVDGLASGNIVLAAEGIREEEDLGSVDLVVDDCNVGVVSGAASEGDGLSLGIAALPVNGGDLKREVLLDLAHLALDVLNGGGALLEGLWGDGYLGAGLLAGIGGPDAGGDL